MTDWKKMAEAQGLKLEDADLAIAVSRLGGLQQQLEAVLPKLAPDDDPAVAFDAGGGRSD
jgi:hypothetical protein